MDEVMQRILETVDVEILMNTLTGVEQGMQEIMVFLVEISDWKIS